MNGEYNIAVMGFTESSDFSASHLGNKLADSVRLRLEKNLEEINPDVVIKVWGPYELLDAGIRIVTAKSPDEQANEAEKIAENFDVNLVVYGQLTEENGETFFTPAFYIRNENFYEAQEIIGPHEFERRSS